MAEATPGAGKPVPLLKKKTFSNNKGPKQMTSQEVDRVVENHNESPSRKKRPHTAPSFLDSSDLFESITADVSEEVSLLMSQFAEVLSVRAAADKAQMKEMEGILTEAQILESFLKEKKTRLRQTLALISDKLKG